ncbi:divinyl chlorophyllide a 8-vinyl-reductase [Aureococcus anophagefferens]|nr:divinyl chlorophyllide a 8-vinyl-reductase [Aureococcus anophagefferens]
MQTHYGPGVTPERHEQFSSLHPAQVIVGHFANFTLLQPVAPGRSVRYVSMVRSPHAWALSLYLHYHHRARGRRRLLPSWPLAFRGAARGKREPGGAGGAHERELGGAGGARVDVAGFLRGALVACPALSRGSNETRCEKSHLYAWDAGRRRSAGADTCADFAAFWTHPSRLLLVNERYDDSIWLLFAMLGAGPPPPPPRKNVRADAAYDAPVTLAAERDVAALIAETCMPDIYVAARGPSSARSRARRVPDAADVAGDIREDGAMMKINVAESRAVAVGAGATTVFVAGATGQTGRRVLERLVARSDVAPSAGVRNVDKAKKTLGEASTAVRGAMVQQVSAVDATGVDFKKLDVVGDDVATMAAALKGLGAGHRHRRARNPLKMDSAAHAVDNLGTVALVDAAKAAGVKKVVLVSSILTNGRAWGQENSPGFQITNAFGHVLDEKIVAENYLRKSGLDYTIVRPGGLKAKPPTGPLVVAKEDTLNSGEVSRDLVADVCVAAVFDAKASNKVVEIIEKDGSPPAPVGGNIFAGV